MITQAGKLVFNAQETVSPTESELHEGDKLTRQQTNISSEDPSRIQPLQPISSSHTVKLGLRVCARRAMLPRPERGL
jgi:hypothetical protein